MRSLALIAVLAVSPIVHAKQDIDKVNGAIRTEAGAEYGALDTVNGRITIAAGARADSASTVNGAIDVGDQAVVGSLETVNGGIDVGAGVAVAEGVETVNGAVEVAAGSRIQGRVETVNGRIELEDADVEKGLHTVNGDVIVGAGSTVRGGILVEKPMGGWFNWGSSSTRKPRVVIGPDAVVEGTLTFEREVELFVHTSARIGPVQGATPTSFSGDQP